MKGGCEINDVDHRGVSKGCPNQTLSAPASLSLASCDRRGRTTGHGGVQGQQGFDINTSAAAYPRSELICSSRIAVRRGAVEKEAERCASLSAARAVLGVQAAARHCAADGPIKAGQGSPAGVQGQAGLRDIQSARATRRPQEARP